jgi:hypothetical protein
MRISSADDPNARMSKIAAILALVFHAVNGLFAAAMGAFPASLDELQHLSFIRAMGQAPALLPRYQDLRVLGAHATRFTAAPNYLNHPSPYYIAMGWADRALGGDIAALRVIDLGLSLAAVGLMLLAGCRVLRGWKERAVFAAALVLFPKLGVVAGLINNDNAALLAVAVAFFGLVEWQARPSKRHALVLAIGLALCGWTKLTVLLMMAFGAAIAEALRWRAPGPRPVPPALAIIAAGLALAAVPSLANLAAYGRLLYHSSAHVVAPAARVALSFPQYGLVFFRDMADKWSALEPAGLVQRLGLGAIVGLGAWAAIRGGGATGEAEDAAAWRVARGLILAAIPVMAIHLWFGWRTFVEDGFVEMAQVRYYYGVWPGFALGLALLWKSAPPRLWKTPAAISAGALLATSSMTFLGLLMLVRGQTRIG